jgi:hypothetical protein
MPEPSTPAGEPERLLAEALRAQAGFGAAQAGFGGRGQPRPPEPGAVGSPAGRPESSGPDGHSPARRFHPWRLLLIAVLFGLLAGVAAGLATLL